MAIDEQALIERILEAENLTDNLEDEAASQLLKWGTSQVGQLVKDTDDEARLGETVKGLMAVMRQINRLAGNLGSASVADLAAGLGRLAKLHTQAFGYAPDASAVALKATATALTRTTASEAVPLLLKWLAPRKK
jgi:hypothetical protein